MPTSFKSKITDSCRFYLRTFGTWLKNPEIPGILDTLESEHQIGSKAAVTFKAFDFQKLEIKSSLLSGRWRYRSECLWLPFSDREVLHNAVRFCQVRRRKVSTDSSHKVKLPLWRLRCEVKNACSTISSESMKIRMCADNNKMDRTNGQLFSGQCSCCSYYPKRAVSRWELNSFQWTHWPIDSTRLIRNGDEAIALTFSESRCASFCENLFTSNSQVGSSYRFQ